jgi:hypothetical protein
MSEEALWTIEFQTASGWTNGGVVVLETERAYGGDSQYYYVGQFSFGGPGIFGKVRVTHYHGSRGTAWGDNATSFEVDLSGGFSPDRSKIEGDIKRSGFPPTRFRMVKREQLP